MLPGPSRHLVAIARIVLAAVARGSRRQQMGRCFATAGPATACCAGCRGQRTGPALHHPGPHPALASLGSSRSTGSVCGAPLPLPAAAAAAARLAPLLRLRAAGFGAACRAARGGGGGVPGPEHVTRTVLGCSAQLVAAGVSPAGIAAFSEAASEGAAAGVDLPSSIRASFSPVTGEQAEQMSDCLLGFGAQSVVVEEAREPGGAEQERFGAEADLWDSCRVLAHFPLEHDVDATVATLREVLELPGLNFTMERVVDREWVEQIKASYVPVQVCDGLFIVPEWSEPTDPAATNVRLTPGVAFGTGEHPTTRLCLRLLSSLDLRGQAVVDYGTGSGVLAIAALLLGAASAVGTDTDPLAVRAAAANAALNGLDEQLQLVQCGARLDDPDPLLSLSQQQQQQQEEEATPPVFDLVVANILRGPLLELAPRLTAYCRPGGRLALSGILVEQAPDVVAAYSDGFEDFRVESDGSWALVTATRRRRPAAAAA